MESIEGSEKVESHQIPALEKEMRLSNYAVGIFESIQTKKGIKKAIKNGSLRVNGEVVSFEELIHGGETIDLYVNSLKGSKPTIDLNLEVVYEDDYLAVVSKPAGLVVSGNKQRTLENALPGCLKKSIQEDALERPEPIHRLDYPTSGVVLIGKTKKAVVVLNKLFEERTIDKTYHAVTINQIKDSGIIETPIEGKSCKTEFRTIERLVSPKFEYLNLTSLKPHTGRRHQLRIHMANMGNPILGDKKYGTEDLILEGKGLFLHASSLKFTHPFTLQQMIIETELPKKFQKLFPQKIS